MAVLGDDCVNSCGHVVWEMTALMGAAMQEDCHYCGRTCS